MLSDRIFRFLGSIKLAVPLLTTIVAILIWATFYESQVGSTTVQQQIYKSPWFGGLMFLLAVNLGVSALSRYPWRGARKIGFAITHLGLIVIIAGSAAVIHLGVEGMLLLRTDRPPNNQIRVEGELLEVMTADGSLEQANLFVKEDGSVNPKSVAGLSLLGYNENTITTVNFTEGGKGGFPAVRLSLTSDRMGQTLERSLAIAPPAYSKINIGPAELEILQVNSQNQLQQLLSPPTEANGNRWGTLSITSDTAKTAIDVEKTLSEDVPLGNITVKVANFWADFRLDKNDGPISISEELNNPAVLLEVSAPTGVERWFLFGTADVPPIRSLVSGEEIEGIEINYEVKPQESEDYFRAIVSDNGSLFYSAKSSSGFKSGTLAVGQSVSPGWADFQITLEEYISNAQLNREVVPVSDPGVEGTPALLVQTETGDRAWLPWGEPTTIKDGESEIFAAFSPKVLELPFAIKLEDFIVDRNEGSESVAMWTSKIRIEDLHKDAISHRNVWMNHPTWYDGWKIAQASWNPGDLKQSTLQVKREPAWVTALTWGGSALVVSGIAIMFYAPALAKKLRQQPTETEKEEVVTGKTKELIASS